MSDPIASLMLHPDMALGRHKTYFALGCNQGFDEYLLNCAPLQVNDAVWVSMLMSAFAGIMAVCLMILTFYCIR